MGGRSKQTRNGRGGDNNQLQEILDRLDQMKEQVGQLSDRIATVENAPVTTRPVEELEEEAEMKTKLKNLVDVFGETDDVRKVIEEVVVNSRGASGGGGTEVSDIFVYSKEEMRARGGMADEQDWGKSHILAVEQ